MLISKTTKVKWNSRNKKYYIDKGYNFTKMGDEFEVCVEDLTNGSGANVNIRCDYCGDIFQRAWWSHLSAINDTTACTDACDNCKHLKASDSVKELYGVNNVFQLEDVKDKIKNTCMEKYGVDNPSKSPEIIQKIENIMLEKYGVKTFVQTEEYQNIVRNSCIEKYGIPFQPQLLIGQQKGENSPRWNGGAQRNGLWRSTYQYRDWHDAVLERDNYTCQCCGITNGLGHRISFHIHHIFNFADNIDLRYEIDNGICFCKDCHYLFHSIYGHKNTNKEQLNEFLLNHGKKIC